MLNLYRKIPRIFSVTIIIVVGLAAPIWGLRNFDWQSFRVTSYSIGFAALYFFIVLAFALYAAGITGGKITSGGFYATASQPFRRRW
jgi:hypothetical protein